MIPSLNGIRAMAVFAVILYHGAGLPMPFGTYGVTQFFILSGFLITWLLLKESDSTGTVSLKGFYWRRALRIFPAFYSLLFVSLVAIKFAASSKAIAVTALYISNYTYPLFNVHIDLLDHAWSLAVEEQFYLLWPLTFLLFRKRLVPVLGTLVAGVWLWRAWLTWHASDRYIYHAFDTRADHLLIGCLLAVLVKGEVITKEWARFWPIPAAIALISYTLDGFSLTFRDAIGFSIEPLCLALLLIAAVWYEPKFLNWKPVAYFGAISYGLYLWHPLCFSVVRHVLHRPTGFFQFVAGTACTVIVSALSFRFFESPILALKHRRRPHILGTKANA